MVIAYHAEELEMNAPRVHPWSRSETDESVVYVDFKSRPDLIRTSLQDFVCFDNEPFVERFYSLLEWLNGPSSLFESNDCAFRGMVENTDEQFPFARKCHGRLMILFRDIAENCQPRSIGWLMQNLEVSIQSINPSFRSGAVGLSRAKTHYKGLTNDPKMAVKGEQVLLSLFAYGKSDSKSFESMEKVIASVHSTLNKVNKKVRLGEVDALYG